MYNAYKCNVIQKEQWFMDVMSIWKWNNGGQWILLIYILRILIGNNDKNHLSKGLVPSLFHLFYYVRLLNIDVIYLAFAWHNKSTFLFL